MVKGLVVQVGSVAGATGAGPSLSMVSNSAWLGAAGSLRLLVPETVNPETLAVTTSVVSRSVTVRFPTVLVSPLLLSLIAALSGPLVITGASLVPVMVIVTVSLLDKPGVVVTTCVSGSMVVTVSVVVTVY